MLGKLKQNPNDQNHQGIALYNDLLIVNVIVESVPR